MADNTELDVAQTARPDRARPDLRAASTPSTSPSAPTAPTRTAHSRTCCRSTADNFDGQGANFNATIKNFARLTDTLANNKEELFGSAEQLGKFVETLARERPDGPRLQPVARRRLGPAQGRARGAGADAEEPVDGADRGLARSSPTTARSSAATSAGLNRVSKVLVKQRDALDEILKVGPLALNNLALTYNPQAGTLDTRANQGQVERPDRVGPRAVPVRADQPGAGAPTGSATRSRRSCPAAGH